MTVLVCRLVDVLHVVERLQQCLETRSVRVFVHVDMDVKVAQDDNRASVRAELFDDGRQFVCVFYCHEVASLFGLCLV